LHRASFVWSRDTPQTTTSDDANLSVLCQHVIKLTGTRIDELMPTFGEETERTAFMMEEGVEKLIDFTHIYLSF